MPKSANKVKCTAADILAVRLLWEATGEMSQEDACLQVGLPSRTFRDHRDRRSKEWQQADEAFIEIIEGRLRGLALGRLSRILVSGQDGPAANLIIRVLGLSENIKHGGDEDAPLRIVLDPSSGMAVVQYHEASNDDPEGEPEVVEVHPPPAVSPTGGLPEPE